MIVYYLDLDLDYRNYNVASWFVKGFKLFHFDPVNSLVVK
jgi:hypothetical protein